MKKYDKSLIEVWDWKERVYQDVKNLAVEDYIEKLQEDADRILSGALVELTRVYPRKELQRAVKILPTTSNKIG